MLGALRALFVPRPPESVEATYIALVAAARNPFFYESLGVPDTIDGRFDLIVLHLFLLQDRIRMNAGKPQGAADDQTAQTDFARFLSEAFFNDLDANLREMGVADTGVSHRIKRMGKAYHGRLQAYSAARNDADALRAALARNLYGTVSEGDVTLLNRMAKYVNIMHTRLATEEVSTILDGRYAWPDAATLGI